MKNIKFLVLAVVTMFLFNSCELSDDSTISGDGITDSPVIIGWSTPSVTESYFEDLGTLDNQYPLNILGGGDGAPTTADVAVSITVNEAETTAVNGEYILNSSNVVIPAGSTFVNVPIGVNTANFSPSEPTKVVLDIATTTNGISVSSLSKTLTINFVGCQSELASYTYNVTILRENTGSIYNGYGESVVENGVNYLQTATVGTWPIPPGVRFTDICGTLYIESHDLADYYSNQVTAASADGIAGEVDENGNFVLRYNISGASSISGPWGNYTATYTKQ